MKTTKIIQALTYLAYAQPEHRIDFMKAYKLMWLADRYQVRSCGRTITGDAYYAMPYGLVPSDAKCMLEGERTKLVHDEMYFRKFVSVCGEHEFVALREPDCDEFSESDMVALDKVIALYGGLDAMSLSDMSHKFPEWTYYEGMIMDRSPKSSYRVNMEHFFEPCVCASDLFDQSEELLSLTKELYRQYNHV